MSKPLRKILNPRPETKKRLLRYYKLALKAGYDSDLAKRVAVQATDRDRQNGEMNYHEFGTRTPDQMPANRIKHNSFTGGKEKSQTFDRLIG